jgi:succinate-acetate transporter protein
MTDDITTIKDTTANPAPLGLVGFGMTTVLLNLHNAGAFENNAMIMGMGIFMGGIAQIVAGWLESKKGNTFGTTAFLAFGLFWLSLVAIWGLPTLGWAVKPDASAMAAYHFVWGLFTFGMFFGTLRLSRALQFIFGSLALLFWLLALGDVTGNATITAIAGWEGVVCGLSAFYTAIAQVLNELYGRTILPLGPIAPRPQVARDAGKPVRRPQAHPLPSGH